MQQPPLVLPLGLERGDPLELPRRRRPQVHPRPHPSIKILREPRPADLPGLRPEAVLPAGHVAAPAREVVGVRPAGFALLGKTTSMNYVIHTLKN